MFTAVLTTSPHGETLSEDRFDPPLYAETLFGDRFDPPPHGETLFGVRFDLSPHVAVKDARAGIDKIYARIRNRVNSYVDDETPVPALDAFVAQLNVITKRFNTLAAHHQHKKGGDKEGGGEE